VLSIAPYAKAVTAFVSTAATTLVASLLVGSDGGAAITTTEWITIAATSIVATLAVFSVPNKPAPIDQA
jgi:hypothetical protein